MNDDMALFLICIAIILFLVYRYSKHGGSYPDEITVEPGIYRIGEELAPGKCDVTALSGSGEIRIRERGKKEPTVSFKLSAASAVTPSSYRNLTLLPRRMLEVNGNLHLNITPPCIIDEDQEIELTQGSYTFGADIPPAKYDLTALDGEGKVSLFEGKEHEVSVSQEMAFSVDGKSSVYHNLLCEAGSRLEVVDTLTLKLTRSQKQRGRMQKILDFLNQDP